MKNSHPYTKKIQTEALKMNYKTMPSSDNEKTISALVNNRVRGGTNFIEKVTNLSPSLIAVYNIHTGKYIFVSNALMTMLGYSPKVWLRKGVSFVITKVHPDDLPLIMQKNQQALDYANKQKKDTDLVVHFEYRVKHARGGWRWLHTYGTVFDRKPNGKVNHVLNVSVDITDQKYTEEKVLKAEEKLRKLNLELENKVKERTKAFARTEAKLKEAQKISHFGNWEYDIKSGKITWSEELFNIHGIDPAKKEPTFEEMLKLFLEPDILIEKVNTAITKGIPYRLDLSIDRHGAIRYIQAIGRPMMDKNGKCIKLYGTTLDITERKKYELNMQFLSEASDLLSTSLNYTTTLQNIVFSAIPHIADWCILDILKNGRFERVLVAHKDPSKKAIMEILQKEYPPDLKAPGGVGKVLRTGKPEFRTAPTERIALKTARNNPQMLALLKKIGLESFMIVPLKSRGIVRGAITFVSSNPNVRYTKSDLAMAEELAHRAAIAIDNAKLYEEAQEAIRLRDEFMSIASHELKTPVTSIKIFAQILLDMFKDKKDAKPYKYLQKINDQINKQTKLISDLLDISRLRVGKFEFTDEYFSLTDLIEEIGDNIQASSPQHKIIISSSLKEKIKADRDRIGQVIINLLTNAIKYSPEANKIVVSIKKKSKQAIVSITDFGIGISRQSQSRIFERFYQADTSSTKTFPGLGIGLYISSEIIKRHGGRLTVKSIKGKGSTFSFSLPLR